MSARLLLICLTLATVPLFGQPYLRITCDSTCLPAFDAVPSDVTATCEEAFPDFVIPAATACAEAPVVNTPSVELDATTVMVHDLETADGDGVDWAIWLGGFEAMGHGASDYFHPTGDGISFEQFANGTARIQGEIVNDTDPSQRFDVEIFLQGEQDYDGWTALGRLPKDDLALGAYVDWTYYEMVDTLSRLVGRGDFEGDMLYLDHMPFSRMFGYQVGENGANNRNTNMGISGWFWYRGIIGGADVTGTGDVNADLNNPTDAGSACPVVETRHRIAMAWSSCGHDVFEQTLERIDEEAPEFLALPPLASASCTDLPDTADITAFSLFDACGSELSLTNVDSVAGEPCNQVAYRTWTLTDACGNSTDTVQSVALVDTTGPSFELADTTIVCDAWDNYEAFVPTFEDDCSPADSVTWVFADSVTSGFFPFYFTLDRVYTATDLCGNSTEETMTISVIDTVAPTWIFLPPDTTILCDNWEDYTVVQPIVEDNCDPNPMGPGGGGATDTTITEGECFGEFTVELTFEFSDMSGNTITYVQVISAIDTVSPTFPFVPADTVIDCTQDWPQPEDGAEWIATAEDNFCPFDVVWTDSIAAGECLGTDTLFRVFTAIDDCGNTTDSLQIITRIDTLAPQWNTIPTDTVIACGADLPVLDLGAMDNCSGVDSVWLTLDTLDIEFGDPVSTGFESCNLAGFVAEGGSISITNEAFDGSCALSMVHAAGEPPHNFYPADIMAGRGTYRVMARADGFISDNMVQLLAGDDVESEAIDIALRPLGTDNPGIEVTGFGLNASTDATMQQGEWYEVRAVLGESELTLFIDSVSVLVVALPDDLPEQGRFKLAAAYAGSYDDMAYAPENPCPVIERFAQTMHAMDGCGNISTAVQVVDVIDTVAPELTFAPADLTIACTEEWPSPNDAAELIAAGEDACTDVSVNWSDVVVPNACPGSSTLTRTFTVSDACGNSVSTVQVITQIDTVAPEVDPATLPLDIAVECDAVPAPLDSADFLVSDNCNEWTFSVTSEVDSGSCAFNYTRLDTYVFMDCDSNVTTYVHTVEVSDNTAPEFTAFPDTLIISCEEDFPAAEGDLLPQASDNCGEVTLIWDSTITDNACPGSSTMYRHFTIEDECGNTTDSVHVIIQVDTVAPVIGMLPPAEVTVECDAVPEPLEAAVFEVTDNCNSWTMTVTSDSIPIDSTCSSNYQREDTYSFLDCDSNETIFVQTLTVVDMTPPVFLYVPPLDSITCLEEYPQSSDDPIWMATAEDNCSALTIEDDTLDFIPGPCLGVDTLYRQFTATDACGNATTAIQVMFRYDDIAPVIGTTPNDTLLDCGSETETLDSTYFQVTDQCYDEWTFGVSTEYIGDPDTSCFFTRYDTYTFTDCSGNVTSYTHQIDVQDTTGPGIVEVPSDLFLDCPQEVPQFDTNAPLSSYAEFIEDFVITDECNSDLEVMSATYEDVVTVNIDATHYTLVRNWTFVDNCGNTTDYAQTIVVDEPELTMPNAFSPAGDGPGNNINDRYEIPNLGTTETEEGSVPPCYWGGNDQTVYFQVFNRWGTRVFASEPGTVYENDWNGTNQDGQPLVNGTYFILLQTQYRSYGVYVDLRNDQ